MNFNDYMIKEGIFDTVKNKMGDVKRKFGDKLRNDSTRRTPWGQIELTQDKDVDTYRNIKSAQDHSQPATTELLAGTRLEIVGGGIEMSYYDMSKIDDLRDDMTFQRKTPVYTLHFDKSPDEFREFAKELGEGDVEESMGMPNDQEEIVVKDDKGKLTKTKVYDKEELEQLKTER